MNRTKKFYLRNGILVSERQNRAMEDVAATANNVIECVNENLHNANLVAESTRGFLPKSQQLHAVWKHVAEERAKTIRQVNILN